MFAHKFKSIFVFLVIFFIRSLFSVVVGCLLLFVVPYIFYTTTDNLDDLEGYYIVERMDDDLLEFYNVAQELEVYGADNEVLAERVVIVARIGKIVFLWVCPALGIIWGFSQGRFWSRVTIKTHPSKISPDACTNGHPNIL